MKFFFKIMTIFFLLSIDNNVIAVDVINNIKIESKNVLKILTRKSLKKNDIIKFINNNIIIIDDKRGDGQVVYYFIDEVYKRYKNLELISQDNWKILRSGHLHLYNNNKKDVWKIQIGKENTINIKKKFNSIGDLYTFSYQDKTDYYLKLEEKKLNDNKQ